MYSPETEARIEALRAAAQSRDLTTEEQKEALTLIRQGRVSASYASAGAKAKKAPVDGGALLSKLQEMMKGKS